MTHPRKTAAGTATTPTTRTIIRPEDLSERRPTEFRLIPDASACAVLAADLGVPGVTRLRFAGTLTPVGTQDWALAARLGATFRQRCVVTLKPVRTRIDQSVTRRYVAGLVPPDETEMQVPDDDTLEPLPATIDLAALMAEALALALPLYPKVPGAAWPDAVFSPIGAEPLTDAAMRPFSGLADLKRKLDK